MPKHTKTATRKASLAKLEKLKATTLVELENLLASDDPRIVADTLLNLKGTLLIRQIQRIENQIAVETGKVHGKDECCLSLTLIFSAACRDLHALGRRTLSRFPELPREVLKAIDDSVDDTIRQMKSGHIHQAHLFCPKCNAKIDEFRLEPLPEDQQPAPVAPVPGDANAGATAI
jgi:hypothetical protein